jgi:dienelactone hydrolase
MTRSVGRRLAWLMALLLLATGLVLTPSSVGAQTNPYERGPAPTRSSLQQDGPYSVTTYSVSRFVSGFGGGTIYYPTGTSQTFAGIAASPGYTASSSSLAWYGRRLASHGFVVIVIDTNSRYDFPDSRATQLQNALDYLTARSPSAVRARLDGNRLAVTGHSMGGGGSLRASTSNQSLRASVPLTPWHSTKTFSTRVPQMIIGAQNDSVASVRTHSIPFYNNLPSSTPKVYLELAGASHFAPNSSNATISLYSISWMKRFVDNDTRYRQFLCGVNHTGDIRISDYRSNFNTYC